jgi:fumarate reductase subunit C
MSGRVELWLYVAQRLSAMVLAPLVIIHIATMVYAIRDGLTAAEILGLRAILREMTAWRSKSLDVAAGAFCLTILVLGLRAVEAVT